MQRKSSHPHPEASQATKANRRAPLCVKAWSGLWILEQTNTLIEPQQQIRYDGFDMAFFCILSLNLYTLVTKDNHNSIAFNLRKDEMC